MRLVLASTSRYRQELLARLRVPFETVAPDVDETARPGEAPPVLVRRLAEAKARAVAGRFPDALVIGSDQVAAVGDEILGKPGTHERAVAQLRKISGRDVVFHTGLCLLNTANGRVQLDLVPFPVRFRPMDEAFIERYLAREPAYDCAGAFKSEGLGIALCDGFAGNDPTALVGLPLIRLVRMLEAEGVHVV